MQKQPAIDNFCTTLPAYIIEMLQTEADRKRNTLSNTLQMVLESHYGIGGWREKLFRDTLERLKRQMAPYGNDAWKVEMDENKEAMRVFLFITLPFKSDILLDINRARYSLQFIIHTTSKTFRKMFRSFYSYYRDGLLNRDIGMEEYARFAAIGFRRNFTAPDIREIVSGSSFAEKITDDVMFLRNIIIRHKWNKS